MLDLSNLTTAYALLMAMPGVSLLGLYWFTLFFEAPRYALGFPAIVAMYLDDRRRGGPVTAPEGIGRVSVLLAGHNEADSIEKAVLSLKQQSFTNVEIICVSDGSTDATFEIMKRLQRQGLVDKVAGCQIRGGKASALNLAARLATGDVFVVLDCDCSLERHSLAAILEPLADPDVGGVSASVLVRNGEASLVASLQAIEYLAGMTLGKAQLDLFGQLTMISGAFGAFRRSAWQRVSGMDPGPGEDLDISLRLRLAGYKLAFAHRAVAYTDVPVTLFNLLRQRNRWERDSLWLRFRKYPRTLNPFRGDFDWRETIHQYEFLFFTVAAASIFPFYLAYLFVEFGPTGLLILLSVTLGLILLDLFVFVCAIIASGKEDHWKFVPYILIYCLFQSYLMRFARLYSFVDEWIFSTSRSDSFAPPKVNAWIRWK